MSASARGAGLAVGVVTLVVAVLAGTGTGSETTVFRARGAPAASADDHLETTAALQTAIVRAELLPPPEEVAAAEGLPGEAGQGHGPPPGFLGSFLVTCYALGGRTATGAPVSTAVVAVDPRVVRLGSHVMIGGVGRRVAADTGGAIRGHRLDIWMPSVSACRQFGVRRLPVYQA